jgi:hypothetical protein
MASDSVSTPSDVSAGPLERVHFSRKSGKDVQPDREGQMASARVVGASLLVLLFVGETVARGYGTTLRAALRSVAGPRTLLLFGPFVLWMLWVWFIQWRNGRGLPETPDNLVRLRCVGSPDEVLRHGELADLPFEPRLFAASLAAPFSRGMRVAWVTAVLGGLIVGMVVGRVVGMDPLNGLTLYLAAAALLGEGVIMLFWPAYFRVVPGRLDILRWRPFCRRPDLVVRCNLRTARILVDLRKSVVLLECPETKRAMALSIGLIWGRTRLAHALFMAALSTYEAAPLPEDALLG